MYRPVYILALLMALSSIRLSAQERGKSLVILANANMPESIELAEYYAAKRQLPVDSICRLDVPVTEDISRAQYESRLLNPLLQFLREGGYIRQEERRRPLSLKQRVLEGVNFWRGQGLDPDLPRGKTYLETVENSLHFLVPVYGIPLRIADLKTRLGAKALPHQKKISGQSIAAVDSELALCLVGSYPKKGSFRNPVYNAAAWAEAGPAGAQVVICSRLDGPTPGIVRRMIDDALEAERYGLQGRAAVDARGIDRGGYFTGDFWLRGAYDRLRHAAYEATLDAKEEIFPEDVPLEDTAFYLGWYAEHVGGAVARDGFRFAPGAVACHLHSGAASTLRSEDEHWAGPLLARGAAVTLGAVHEPYLQLTADLNIFTSRLCAGFSFGESAYMAMPALSWQMTIVGDPLYRPFRFTLDQQIAHMEEDNWPRLEWGYARKVVQLVQDGFFNLALDYARTRIKEKDSLVLRELLGDLYLKNNLLADAGMEYQHILRNTRSEVTSIRVGQRWRAVLALSGDTARGDRVAEDLRHRWPNSALLGWLNREPVLP